MRSIKLVVGGILTAAAVAVPLSSASAHCGWRYHRCYGRPVVGVVGAAGGIVEGALAVATLPVVLAADIVSAPFAAADDYGPYHAPYDYYGPRYAHGPAYYGPAYYGQRRWYRRHYGRAYCCSYGY